MSYPSFTDPRQDIARSLGYSNEYPQTLYYDARGRFVFDHGGSYRSQAELEHDIQRYALR